MTETWDPESKCRTDSRVRCQNQDSRTGLTFKLLKLLSKPTSCSLMVFSPFAERCLIQPLGHGEAKRVGDSDHLHLHQQHEQRAPVFRCFQHPSDSKIQKKTYDTRENSHFEPKNGGLQGDVPFETGDFQVPCQFSRVYHPRNRGPFPKFNAAGCPEVTKVGVLLISGWAWRPKNPPLLPQAPLEFLVARLPLSTLSIKNSCEQIQSSSSPCQRVYPLEIANTLRLILQNGGSATMFTKCAKSKTEQGDYHCSGKTKEIGKLKLWT